MHICENYTTDPATGGATFKSTQSGGIDWPAALLSLDASGTPVYISNSNPVPISDAGGIITVDGTVNAAQSGSWSVICTNAGTFVVQVNGDALTALQLLDDAVATTGSAITTKGFAAAGTDGTNARILKTDSSGELQVDVLTMPAVTISGTVTVSGNVVVTNAGTFAVQVDGAALTALQLLDDVVYVDDADWTALTSKHALVGGVYQSTPGTIADGDTGPIRVDQNGHIIVSPHGTGVALADSTGNTVNLMDDDGGSLLANACFNFYYNGTSWDRFRGTSTDGLLVNLGTNNDVTITSGTITTVTTLTGGGVANDSADSGNPVKVGARASATLSDDTMVANGDRTDLVSDLDNALITRPQFPLSDLISESVSNTNGTSTAFTNFGATASTRNYIYGYSIFRTDSGTTPIYVDFRDGTAGSVLWSVVIPAGGGANLASTVPLFRSSANTAIAYDVSAATTTVYISVNGAKSKV